MGNLIDSILLGLVQGLTEFLPVSSSGHLVLAQELLGYTPGEGILFEVAVHLATLVAIACFYHLKVRQLVRGAVIADKDAWRYIGKLALATLPAVGVALTARDLIESQFESLDLVGICLIITGFLVFSTRFTREQGGAMEPNWWQALVIGCAQAVAILPGISRSGTTVATAMALGLSPLAAAEFSFMLGMVAIAGAGVLLLPEIQALSSTQLIELIPATGAALISGLFALWLFVWLLREQKFHHFAWYAWTVGIGVLLFW